MLRILLLKTLGIFNSPTLLCQVKSPPSEAMKSKFQLVEKARTAQENMSTRDIEHACWWNA